MNELKTSQCSLYLAKIPFSFEDNYILEGAEDSIEYLFTKVGFTFLNVQFSKFENKLKYVLRLDDNFNAQYNQISMSLSYYTASNYKKLFNYAMFKVDSTYKKANVADEVSTGYYLYFVNGVKWKSPQTIELDLKMDTLNTLYIANQLGYTSTNFKHIYELGKKSNITRYHKKRVQVGTLPTDRIPLIDKVSEGISAPLYKKSDYIFNTDAMSLENYYLIYKNSLDDSSDTQNVVDCYLTYGTLGTPQNKTILVEGQTLRRFTASNVGNTYIYLLSPFKFTLYDEITQENKTINVSVNTAYCEISKVGSSLRIRTDLLGNDANTTYYISNAMDFETDITYYYSPSMINHPPTRNDIQALPSSTLTITDSTLPFYDINKLNRTDSKLIKVIKLPYAPTNDIQYENSHFIFSSSIWRYDSDSKMLKLIDLNTNFRREVVSESLSTTESWNDVMFTPFNPSSKSPTSQRDIANEYKLYHSDFRYSKLNYDSFNLIVYNELLRWPYLLRTSGIDFYTTTTINSRFIFRIRYNVYSESFTDYPETLSVARNNELGLYNSSYINYIRNGFNYDVKNKNRSVGVQYGLGAVQILGAVGSAISSAYTGGFGVAGAISLGTSAIATLTHAINTQISQEAQIQQKLETLKAQANEVESSDDVDLLNVYNSNKLHRMRYEVSDEMKQLLFNLFHYTGYKANIIDNISNYLNTRYWFNYIQCNLNLINVSKQIPIEILEEFKAKFKEGITLFHRHATIINSSVDEGYNIKQDLENWDVELVDET